MLQVRRDIMNLNDNRIDYGEMDKFLIKEIEFVSSNIVLKKTGEKGIQLETLGLPGGSMTLQFDKKGVTTG